MNPTVRTRDKPLLRSCRWTPTGTSPPRRDSRLVRCDEINCEESYSSNDFHRKPPSSQIPHHPDPGASASKSLPHRTSDCPIGPGLTVSGRGFGTPRIQRQEHAHRPKPGEQAEPSSTAPTTTHPSSKASRKDRRHEVACSCDAQQIPNPLLVPPHEQRCHTQRWKYRSHEYAQEDRHPTFIPDLRNSQIRHCRGWHEFDLHERGGPPEGDRESHTEADAQR